MEEVEVVESENSDKWDKNKAPEEDKFVLRNMALGVTARGVKVLNVAGLFALLNLDQGAIASDVNNVNKKNQLCGKYDCQILCASLNSISSSGTSACKNIFGKHLFMYACKKVTLFIYA